MDKRTILIVLGVMVAMFGLQRLIDVIYPPVPKKVRPSFAVAAAATNGTNVASAAVETTEATTNEVAPANPEPPSASRPPEQTVTLSNELMRVEVTSWGGGIKTIELLKHRGSGMSNTFLNGSKVPPALELAGFSRFSVDDIRDLPLLASNLRQKPDAVSAFLNSHLSRATLKSLAAYQGPDSKSEGLLTNLVASLNEIIETPALYEEQRFTGITLRPKAQQLLQNKNLSKDDLVRLNRMLLEDAYPQILAKDPFINLPAVSVSNDFIIENPNPTTAILRAPGMTKTLTLTSNYLLQAEFTFDHATAATLSNAEINVGTAEPLSVKEPPNYLNVDWENGPKWSNRDVKSVTKRTTKGENYEPLHVHWVAVKDQYFVMIVSTPTNITGVTYAPVTLPPWPELKGKAPPVGVTAVAQVPLAQGTNGSASCSFTYYAGPKDYDQLLALGQNQEQAMDFGSWLDGYTGIFGLILLRSLNFFYGLIANYGIAIILVTVTLKLIFWPIQAKSIKSMKAMQQFQPQIAKLKEKFKDDPTRLNTETMALYRKHKINPFAGCLPMLVQLPVLYGFYRLLMCDIALRGAAFLWIKDLSQPDTVGMIAGIAINPLPIAMTVSGILQQKLTPTSGDQQQAKMMMFMPLIMLMFFYNLASGLTLYYTLQQLLSVLQQWLAMRHDKKPGAAIVVTGKIK